MAAFTELPVRVPVEVRLAGTHVEEGILRTPAPTRPALRSPQPREEPAMAILVTEKTTVLVQGATGRIGRFHTEETINCGTAAVGGVTPGTRELDRPVFDTGPPAGCA